VNAELVMGGHKPQVLAQIEASSLTKGEVVDEAKKLNYSQNKSEIRRTGFPLIAHQDYGQMLLLIR
jgi:hypothetical protein